MNSIAILIVSCIIMLCAPCAQSQKVIHYPTYSGMIQSPQGLSRNSWYAENQARVSVGNNQPGELMIVIMRSKNPMYYEVSSDSTTDIKPRIFVVCYADTPGGPYTVICQNNTIIPVSNVLQYKDVLDSLPIITKDGTIHLQFSSYDVSAKDLYKQKKTFSFRYQDGCCKLLQYQEELQSETLGFIEKKHVRYDTRTVEYEHGKGKKRKKTESQLKSYAFICCETIDEQFDPN